MICKTVIVQIDMMDRFSDLSTVTAAGIACRLVRNSLADHKSLPIVVKIPDYGVAVVAVRDDTNVN